MKITPKIFIKDPFEEDRLKFESLESMIGEQLISNYEKLYNKIDDQRRNFQQQIINLNLKTI